MSFEVSTTKKVEVIDITAEVEKTISSEKGVAAVVFVPHATAALIVNEYEPNIKADYEKFFSRIARGEWMHNVIDDNAEAHLLGALISPSVTVPVKDGRLTLGTWQRVMLVELDGPRRRKVYISLLE